MIKNFIGQSRKSKTEISSVIAKSMIVLHREKKKQTAGTNNVVIQKEGPVQAVFVALAPSILKFKSPPSLSAEFSRIIHFNVSIVRMNHTIRFYLNNGKLYILNKYF